MYYFQIKNETQITGASACRVEGDGLVNVEVSEETYNAYCAKPDMYVWDGSKMTLDPEYEAREAQKEAMRIANLNLTGADVERGIYQAKGMDFEDIIEMVTQLQPEGLDVKALKIELKANNFYRGNPYVDAVGTLIGLTNEQLDRFFETNDYMVLLPPVEEPTDEEKSENPINSEEDVPEVDEGQAV